MNPLCTRIHCFLWCTMIWRILYPKFWSGSTPMEPTTDNPFSNHHQPSLNKPYVTSCGDQKWLIKLKLCLQLRWQANIHHSGFSVGCGKPYDTASTYHLGFNTYTHSTLRGQIYLVVSTKRVVILKYVFIWKSSVSTSGSISKWKQIVQ